MSGGSLDYVYLDVVNAIEVAELDDEQGELLDDVAQLLHDLEWSLNGDHPRESRRRVMGPAVRPRVTTVGG